MDDEADFFDDLADDGDDPDEQFFMQEMAADAHAERQEREEANIRDHQQRGNRLTLEDCANPGFDRSQPVRRRVRCRGRAEYAYEWVTVTDEFVQVGITYFLRDGMLSISAFEPRNAQLFNQVVRTPGEFARAMKDANRAHRKLTQPPVPKRSAPKSRNKQR